MSFSHIPTIFPICVAVVLIHAAQYNKVIDKVTCDFNVEYQTNFTCEVEHYNESVQMVSMCFDILPDKKVDNLYMLFSAYNKRLSDKDYRTFLGVRNISLDICGITSGQSTSVFFDMIEKEVRKYSNIMRGCPYQGHIYFKDWQLEDAKFPIVPIGAYRFQWISYMKSSVPVKNIWLSTINLYFRILPKKYTLV